MKNKWKPKLCSLCCGVTRHNEPLVSDEVLTYLLHCLCLVFTNIPQQDDCCWLVTSQIHPNKIQNFHPFCTGEGPFSFSFPFIYHRLIQKTVLYLYKSKSDMIMRQAVVFALEMSCIIIHISVTDLLFICFSRKGKWCFDHCYPLFMDIPESNFYQVVVMMETQC